VKQSAVVSTFYNAVSMVRTIDEVLGLPPLEIPDGGVGPMTDAFDIRQNCFPKSGGGAPCWSYAATPSTYPYNTALPVPGADSINPASVPNLRVNTLWCGRIFSTRVPFVFPFPLGTLQRISKADCIPVEKCFLGDLIIGTPLGVPYHPFHADAQPENRKRMRLSAAAETASLCSG
jgi:hypothetical protein